LEIHVVAQFEIQVVVQFEIHVLLQFESTPKAFANFSPGLLQPWVSRRRPDPTLKAFAKRDLANAFSVEFLFLLVPRVVASSNPGLKLANAFGVLSN